jgi:DNA polymerase
VPGDGLADANLVLLGEAPGKKEDRSGKSFVGRAGAYLDKIFHSHSLDRNTVFITSVLKCYHPDSPKKPQIEACLSWTEKQIELLQPEIILVMGRAAEQGLFGKRTDGKSELNWKGIPCVVTCHPAAAMRFPRRHKQFEQDFKRFVQWAEKEEWL